MSKGDGRRPRAIGEQAFASNWCRAHGHQYRVASRGVEWCRNCHRTREDIESAETINSSDLAGNRPALEGGDAEC